VVLTTLPVSDGTRRISARNGMIPAFHLENRLDILLFPLFFFKQDFCLETGWLRDPVGRVAAKIERRSSWSVRLTEPNFCSPSANLSGGISPVL